MAAPRPLRAPLMVLAIGLLATLIAAIIVHRVETARQRARFESLSDAVANTITGRLSEQRLLLRGVAALFYGSRDVSRAEFDAYVARLRLAQFHPGVLGVGYVVRIRDEAHRARIVAQARADGLSDFRAWAPGGQAPASTILYINPADGVNRRALGYDMASEPTRRAAMMRAIDTGFATMSGKVRLIQDQGTSDGVGFLLYVPINRATGATPGTAAYRDEGWAYSPLRANNLIATALRRPNLSGAAVEVYDGAATPANLLFRSPDFPEEPRLSEVRQVHFGGRDWTLKVAASPTFYATAPVRSMWAVIGGGAVVSLLLCMLALQQARSVRRTNEEVERATAELRAANAALVAAGEEKAAAEAQIRQMQKIEAIGQLTGGIAHDFNNMLAVVLGNLDLAARRGNEPEKVARAMAAAKEGATRAAELTRRLLAFGRQQPLMPRLLDVNRLIADMTELLRRTLGEQIMLETVAGEDLWPVEADASQLENAVLNLAINSRDAMPDGGRLTVETRNIELSAEEAARFEDLNPGQYVMIVVSDTGTGMSPDILSRALDPFFSTKEVGKGTGLGLSQVFGFVKQSSGHLNIRSAVGEGTSVEVYLRRAHGSPRVQEQSGDWATPPPGRADELILVVEDEPEVRLTTTETLRDLGYTVLHASDGAEALEVLERHGEVALLFTDLVMPGMSGRELAEKARARFPRLRVLFTSGYAPEAAGGGLRIDPETGLLTKPFTVAELAGKVRTAIDAPRAG